MLEFMRKNARSWLMKILLGIVIIVFIFYFGSTRGDKMNEIALVNGKAISVSDYHREFQKLIDIYRERYGGNLTDDMIKGLNLKQQVYDGLIYNAIILQKAKELNLVIADEEVRAFIASNPMFHRGGVFDKQIYEQVLRQNKMTPADYEADLKNGLTITGMQHLFQGGVKVSDEEVFDLYRFQNEKINVKYLVFSTKDFKKGIKSDYGKLESYLKNHENEFRVAEKLQVKYLFFAGQDFGASAKLSDADITDYYERHKDSFVKKKGEKPLPLPEVRNRIISELKETQGMHIAAAEAKKAHDTIYQKGNFDDYARQSGLKIGITDFFDAKETPQEFRNLDNFTKTVLDLQKDDISSVMSNSKGYYLFKLAAKKPSYMPSLKDVMLVVEGRYLEEESGRVCKREAEGVVERLKKGEAWEKISSEKGLKVSETGFFTPGASVPKIGSSREMNESLTLLSSGNPYAGPFYVNGNYVIIRFKERGEVDKQDFETKKASMTNMLLSMKKNECLQLWLDNQKANMLKKGKLKLFKDVKDL